MQKSVQRALLVVSMMAAPAAAQSLQQLKTFDIPAQPLPEALMVFSRQSRLQVVTASEELDDRPVRAVRGSFAPRAVLDQLLLGTGLHWRQVGEGTIIVEGALKTSSSPDAKLAAAVPAPGLLSQQDAHLAAAAGDGPIIADSLAPEAHDEIIVTAQRRREPLRQIPQSASVLRGDELSRSGLQSLQDIATRVPGLTVDSAGGAGQQQITLRGITTGSDQGPTVSIYVDDVPYGSSMIFSGAAQLALELGSFDVDRIEILRGPQGTLYGASAFGGVLKYELRPPSLTETQGEVQLEGSFTHGGGFNNGLRGALGVALVPDKLAVRGTFSRNRSAGLIDDPLTGEENVDDSVSTVSRLSVLYSPVDELKLRATGLVQHIVRHGTSQVDYNVADSRPTFGQFQQVRLRSEPFDQKVKLFSGGADYDFGFATLSATAGFQRVDTTYSLDFSFYVPLLGPVLESLGSPVDAIGLNGTYFTDKTTLEARLVSPANRAFEWLVGVYYTKEKSVNFQGLFGSNNGRAVAVDIGQFTLPVSFEEEAAYADATYHFTSRFDATLGLRLSHNRQTFAQQGTGLLGSSNPGGASDDEVATYLGTLRYHLADGGILYARAASGYRPGGPNLVAFAPGTNDLIGDSTYQADTLWNYEVGAKAKLAPWLSFDGSVYYILWKNIQLPKAENGLSVVGNGGDATSKGAEISLSANPAKGWMIDGALAYTDAQLKDASPDLGGRAGERLPNVPKWGSTLSASYRFTVSHRANASVSALWRYVGRREATFDASANSPQYVLPSYNSFDLRAGVDLASWNIDLYLRNVLDRRGQAAADLGATGFGYPAAVTVIQPRTIGLVVTKDF